MDVEETVDTIADVVKDTAKEGTGLVPVVVGLLALGAGIGIGYILGRRNNYEVIQLGDLPITRPPKVVVDVDDLEDKTVEEPVAEVETQIITQTTRVPASEVTVNNRPIERTNIFASGDPDDWDQAAEERKRKLNPDEPFIVHRDEFFAEDPATEDFIQSQLTYYEGDGVLVNEQLDVVYDVPETIGTVIWGHGSGDPNICYVRNLVRNTEYEVIRDPGHHSVEVLHLDMEAQENEKDEKRTRVRRMRQAE